MSDDTPTEPRESTSGQEQAANTDDGTHGWVKPVGPRTTAPMSDFSGRDVAVGLVVLLLGLAVTFAIPLALA